MTIFKKTNEGKLSPGGKWATGKPSQIKKIAQREGPWPVQKNWAGHGFKEERKGSPPSRAGDYQRAKKKSTLEGKKKTTKVTENVLYYFSDLGGGGEKKKKVDTKMNRLGEKKVLDAKVYNTGKKKRTELTLV